jgi:hypothetical protein
MKKIILSLLMLTLGLIASVHADSFTDIQIGARPQGMGGAFVAVADDANALYWNPAGIIQNGYIEVTAMRSMPLLETENPDILTNDYVAYSQPLGLRYGFGFSWLRNAAKLEEGSSKNINKMTEDIYCFSFALLGTSNFFIGITFKRLVIDTNTKIGSRAGLGFDFGILYKVTDYISFGALFRNLATNVKNEKVSSTIRLGTAIKFRKDLLLAFDVNGKEGINGKKGTTYLYHFGLEKHFGPHLALRIGSNKNYNLSFGLGFTYNIWNLDYAYYKCNDDLDYFHRLAFSMHFSE